MKLLAVGWFLFLVFRSIPNYGIGQVPSPTPTISKEDAITSAENNLGGTHNDKEPSLEYYVQPSGDLALTYVVEIQTPDGEHWFEAFVDASNGSVLAANDFVASASYLAVDPTAQDITKGYNTYTDPADTFSSPNGWHQVGSTTSTDTSGNLSPRVITYRIILMPL